MPVRRPNVKSKRDVSKLDQLIEQAGVDPEVQNDSHDNKQKADLVGKRKIGKNKDPRFKKQLLYLPTELANQLKKEAFENDEMDMSDIVAEMLRDRYSDI